MDHPSEGIVKDTVNVQMFATVLFLLYSPMRQIRKIKNGAKMFILLMIKKGTPMD